MKMVKDQNYSYFTTCSKQLMRSARIETSELKGAQLFYNMMVYERKPF